MEIHCLRPRPSRHITSGDGFDGKELGTFREQLLVQCEIIGGTRLEIVSEK